MTSHVQGVLPFEMKGVTCMLHSQIDDEPVVADNCQTPSMKNSRKTLNASEKEITKILADKKKRQDNARKKRQNESPEQKAERLSKQRAYAAAKRKKESVAERENRLYKVRNIKANQSIEAREKRLIKQREYATSMITNESPEARHKRSYSLRSVYNVKLNIFASSIRRPHLMPQ